MTELIYPLQIAGIIFSVLMLYFTYYTYKRKNFALIDAAIWFVIWGWFLFALIFSDVVAKLLEPLKIVSLFDLMLLSAVAALLVLVIYLHKRVSEMEKKVNDVVRKVALKDD